MDWKDALKNLQDSNTLPPGPSEEKKEEKKVSAKDRLKVEIDKRNRKGKTATIVYGFTCDDAEVEEVARQLRQKLGTGGSCRGGEILLQGDWKSKTEELLKKMGYRI